MGRYGRVSEKDLLIEMLSRAGVRCVVSDDGSSISVHAGDGPRNRGYSGFVACFEFDPVGDLVQAGVWE